MPKNIRPVWIDVDSDALKKPIGTGPTTRSGQATATVKVRNESSILDLLKIEGIGSDDGKTVLIRVTDKRTHKTLFEEAFKQ